MRLFAVYFCSFAVAAILASRPAVSEAGDDALDIEDAESSSDGIAEHMELHDRMITSTSACFKYTEAQTASVRSSVPKTAFGKVERAFLDNSSKSQGVINVVIGGFPSNAYLDVHLCSCEESQMMLHVAGFAYKVNQLKRFAQPPPLPGTASFYEADKETKPNAASVEEAPRASLLEVSFQQDLRESQFPVVAELEGFPGVFFNLVMLTRTLDMNNRLQSIEVAFAGGLVPGWFNVRRGMHVHVGDLEIGHIEEFKDDNTMAVKVHVSKRKRLYKKITLHTDGKEEEFTVASMPQDQTQALAGRILVLLQHGQSKISFDDGE